LRPFWDDGRLVLHLSVQNAAHGTPTFYCAKTTADTHG
jgi:hypothetical protein